VIVLAGDICPDLPPHDQLKWLDWVLRRWLATLPTDAVVAVAGNHDRCWSSAPDAADLYAAGHQPDRLALPWEWLCDRETTSHGLRIHGTPWVPHVGDGWAFQAPTNPGTGDRFLRTRYDLIKPGLDVLVSHAPPHGHLDRVWGAVDRGLLGGVHEGWVHAGSEPLTGVIRRLAPRLVVCGHIHLGRGCEPLAVYRGSTLLVNCAAMGEFGQLVPEPWVVVDLPEDGGEAVLVRKGG
jgi:hypothetical protein